MRGATRPGWALPVLYIQNTVQYRAEELIVGGKQAKLPTRLAQVIGRQRAWACHCNLNLCVTVHMLCALAANGLRCTHLGSPKRNGSAGRQAPVDKPPPSSPGTSSWVPWDPEISKAQCKTRARASLRRVGCHAMLLPLHSTGSAHGGEYEGYWLVQGGW